MNFEDTKGALKRYLKSKYSYSDIRDADLLVSMALSGLCEHLIDEIKSDDFFELSDIDEVNKAVHIVRDGLYSVLQEIKLSIDGGAISGIALEMQQEGNLNGF